MSSRYDQLFLDIPIEKLVERDYVYDCGTQYARIPGFPDYFVTDAGDVISMVKERAIIMKSWKNQHGHLYVQLSDRFGNREKLLVHKLVAEAFIPNPNNYPIVRHLNDVPYDNTVDNLAWGTYKDNRVDCIRNGHSFAKPVYCFETNKIYGSGAQASDELGVSKSTISKCCNEIATCARGYHFCYESDIKERMNDLSWMRNRSLKPIKAYGPDGEVLYFKSRNDAAREIGIPACGISSVVNGHLSHTHGWRFEEGE